MPGEITDDAPLATSKRGKAVDHATDSLIENKGDSLIGRSVTINRPAAELFAYFRDFTNLPTFMDNVERIDVLDDRRSHWVVKAPGGKTVEWTAVITEEAPGAMIAWASDDDADVANSGRIDFRDAGQARRDLRRFKQLMETGEIATAARTRAQLEEEKA
jgi:uncharacterized membrane protein